MNKLRWWQFWLWRMPEGREWNFTQGGWGYSAVFDGNGKFHGWCSGIQKGDILLKAMRSGKVGRYRVTSIRYERDPSDMFWATAKFVGYKEAAS